LFRDKGIFLMSVFNELNESLDMKTFETRLLLQKKVFLLQSLGLPLNFNYGWYIRGPYSTDLARTGFEMQNLFGDAAFKKNVVSPVHKDQKEIIKKALAVFKAIDALGTNKIRWYELAASLLFLKTYTYPTPRNSRELLRLLEEKKPNEFSEEEKEKAMSCLKSSSLL
jgi:uncharacterized protein YwgA